MTSTITKTEARLSELASLDDSKLMDLYFDVCADGNSCDDFRAYLDAITDEIRIREEAHDVRVMATREDCKHEDADPASFCRHCGAIRVSERS